MQNLLKISVIVPCYNQALFLEECVMSLLNQEYTNWECILVNDGSTDHTEQEAKNWENKDPRIRYYKKTNGGLSSARNFGLKHVTGDYIQFLDCDDFLDPEKFSKSIGSLANAKDNVVITNFYELENKTQKKLPAYCLLENRQFNYETLLKEWDKTFTIPIHCAIFPYTLVKNYQFDEQLKAKEDWLFWLQIYENNPETIFIDEPLACYRISDYGMTRNDDFLFENQIIAHQKIIQLVNKELYHSFLTYNNTFYLKENFELKKEIKRLREKRKLKYKVNKILKVFKLR